MPMSESESEGPQHDQEEYARLASGHHASMLWWFSMESPVEQERRLEWLAYSREYDMVDQSEMPDKPRRYRSPRK